MWGEDSTSIVLPDGRKMQEKDVIKFPGYYGIGPGGKVTVEHTVLWKINKFSGDIKRGPPIGIKGEPWRPETECFAPESYSRPEIILPGGWNHYGIHPDLNDVVVVGVEEFPTQWVAAHEANIASNADALEKGMIKAESEAATGLDSAVKYAEALKMAHISAVDAVTKRKTILAVAEPDAKRQRN